MNVTDRLDDGKTYEMKSKYEYWPQMIDVQIRLSYEKGTGPVNATCSSNIEPIVEPTESATGDTEQVASTNIIEVHTWEDNGQKIMQGKCFIPITEKIENFYLAVTLDQDTSGIVVSLYLLFIIYFVGYYDSILLKTFFESGVKCSLQ
jgi:hypothetical protein